MACTVWKKYPPYLWERLLANSNKKFTENLISRKQDEVNQILDRQKEIVLQRRIEGAEVRGYLEHLFLYITNKRMH